MLFYEIEEQIDQENEDREDENTCEDADSIEVSFCLSNEIAKARG